MAVTHLPNKRPRFRTQLDSILAGESRQARWQYLTRRDIPDITNVEETYLRRYKIIETPRFALYLHKILLPDADRTLHDHPWPFWCAVLSNGYIESFAGDLDDAVGCAQTGTEAPRTWRPGSLHKVRRGEFHSIRRFRNPNKASWSLVVTGKRGDAWGYATPDGYVDHDTYHLAHYPADQIAAYRAEHNLPDPATGEAA